MTCNITGTAISPNGLIKPGARIAFKRAPMDVVSQSGSFVIPDELNIQSRADGTVDFDILPGVYLATAYASVNNSVDFRFSVPDDVSADFSDCLSAAYVEIPPASVTQAQQARDEAVAAALSAQLAAQPRPADFGAVLDGITDDTEAIRDLHEWCNANNVSPNYRGVAVFAVRADAGIDINTSVDFNGAEIRLLNGIQALDGWTSNRNRAFIVSDPSTPLISGMVAVTGGNFATGSYDTCQELIAGAGYVFYEHNTGDSLPRISARDGTTSRAWRIANKVFANGKTQWPLPVGASGLTQVWRSYRLNSKSTLICEGATFRHSDFNNQRLFDVQRNDVILRSFTLSAGSGVPARSTNDLVRIYYCSDVTVERWSGVNPSNDQSLGTYVILCEAAANVVVRDCTLRGGNWGWQASNFSNGLWFDGCDVPRIDAHDYSMNIFVDRCVLHERGVAVGHGGGVLRVTNTTFHQTRNDFPLLQGRPDYGRGSWDGDVMVEGWVVVSKSFGGSNGIVIVDFGTSPVGNAEIALTFPHTISVRNGVLQTTDPGSVSTRIVTPVFLSVSPTGMGVRAPRSIVAADIKSGSRVAFSMLLDLGSCLPPLAGSDAGCSVELVRLAATHFNTISTTVSIPAAGAAPKGIKRTDILLDSCTKAVLSLAGADYNGSRLRVRGGSVGRAVVPQVFNVRYIDVDFDEAVLVGSETLAPICATASGQRYCSIVGGRVAGAYDLSKIVASSGLVSDEATIGSAALPAGVTRQQLFTGWLA